MWSRRLAKITATSHSINLDYVTVGSHKMHYREGPDIRAVTQEHFDEQLRSGSIETANIEWASPVLFDPKKDVKLQSYINYRRFNFTNLIDTSTLLRFDG